MSGGAQMIRNESAAVSERAVTRLASPSGRATASPGFTLVEMLIALVVAGLLAGGVLSLLLHQNDFYGKNDDTIYAEQTMRGTAELVASELRMVSPGSSGTNTDFLLATPDSVKVRFDTERAVVCSTVNYPTLYLYVYDEPTAVNLSGTGGTAYSGRSDPTFQYDDGWDASGAKATNSSSLSYTSCVAANGGVPQSADITRYRSVDWSQNGGGLPTATNGGVVRVYRTLAYAFAPSSFTSGTALWRNGQELVAPFASGAKFEYVMADGTVQSSVSGASFANIRRIRISAKAIGSGKNRYDVSRDLSFDIPVRNLP